MPGGQRAGPGVRFFVLQNGLESRATHYFNESLAWREVCAARDIPCRLYANRKAPASVTGPLGAIPAFSFAADDGVRFDPATQAMHDMVFKGDFFTRECRVLEAHGATADDVVIVPYAGAAEMLGLARWLEARRQPTRPRVVTIMHRQNGDWRLDARRETVVAGQTGPLRYGAQRLARAAGTGRFLFAANSGRLATLLSHVAGIEAAALPVLLRHGLAAVMADREGEAAMPSFRGRRFDIGLLGEFRAEKGGRLALAVLARCFAAHPGLTVVVQVADETQAQVVRDALAGMRGGGGVALVIGQLSPDEFEACVGACRLLALPYHPGRYAARVSGLFAEAVAWGRPVVAPAGTWMSDMIAEGRAAGELFAALTAEEVAAAMVRALAGLPTLSARARALAPAWRQAECMEAAVARIAGWAGRATP